MADSAPVSGDKAEHVFFGVGSAPTPLSKPLPANQPEFEKAVLDNISQRYPELGDVIREQVSSGSVTKRWGSGAGFYTSFHISSTARPLPSVAENPLGSEAYVLRGVEPSLTPDDRLPIEHRGSGLCGAILFHRQGFIRYLDCHNYGEGWPKDEYVFWFLGTDKT